MDLISSSSSSKYEITWQSQSGHFDIAAEWQRALGQILPTMFAKLYKKLFLPGFSLKISVTSVTGMMAGLSCFFRREADAYSYAYPIRRSVVSLHFRPIKRMPNLLHSAVRKKVAS